MTTLNSFFPTDGVDDVLDDWIQDLLGAVIRAEYVNTETITATKELADSDCQMQVITPSGANQTVELAPEATTNHVFFIKNPSGATYDIPIKDDSGVTTYCTLDADQWALCIPAGSAWHVIWSGDLGASPDTTVQLSSNSPRVYTSGDTWTKPAGLVYVIVEVVGSGGGGGGAASATSQSALGGSGGGGDYAKGKIVAASLGATETVTVGAGGAAGTAGANNGSAGNTSSFGAHVTAAGGGGGSGQTASATVPRSGAISGAGGTGGSGGSIRIDGENGFDGSVFSIAGVGVPTQGGGNQLSSHAYTNALNVDGSAGKNYGGGGSGGRTSNSTTDRAGGAGAAGVVIVWEYVQA